MRVEVQGQARAKVLVVISSKNVLRLRDGKTYRRDITSMSLRFPFRSLWNGDMKPPLRTLSAILPSRTNTAIQRSTLETTGPYMNRTANSKIDSRYTS